MDESICKHVLVTDLDGAIYCDICKSYSLELSTFPEAKNKVWEEMTNFEYYKIIKYNLWI
jgi:uncharacterized Zn finger protein (UPF0148 family)